LKTWLEKTPLPAAWRPVDRPGHPLSSEPLGWTGVLFR
jgi:hypothetical protein